MPADVDVVKLMKKEWPAFLLNSFFLLWMETSQRENFFINLQSSTHLL